MEFRPGEGAAFVRRAELVILLFPAAFASGIFLAFSWILAVIFGALCLVIFAVCFFSARKRLKCYTLKIDGKYAVISRGTHWRRLDIIPLKAVITAEMSSHLLSGRMGLCNIKLGVVRRRIVVPLITHDDGEKLLREIRQNVQMEL